MLKFLLRYNLGGTVPNNQASIQLIDARSGETLSVGCILSPAKVDPLSHSYVVVIHSYGYYLWESIWTLWDHRSVIGYSAMKMTLWWMPSAEWHPHDQLKTTNTSHLSQKTTKVSVCEYVRDSDHKTHQCSQESFQFLYSLILTVLAA